VHDVAIGLRTSAADAVTAAQPPTAEWLCETYANRIYKFALLVSCGSQDAEDLAQDALERALRGLKTFDPSKGEIEGWLWRIVVNAGRDAGRIARRQRLVFDRLVDLWSLNVKVIDLGDHFASAELLEAVRALPPRRRAVIALRYGADLDYKRVGMALGISEAAALMVSRRAIAALRSRLSHEVHST
jgi:RNA polymerase sigma-70 factor (ECF subfamily)